MSENLLHPNDQKKKIILFFLILLTIGIGLFSRSSYIPDFIYPYLGDALYALMIYFGLGFLFSKPPSLQMLLASVAICFLIEISQLYNADWISAIHQTRIGALVLGQGFLWSDLIVYLFGAIVGFL